MKIRKATKKDLKKIAEIFRIESAKKPYLQKRNRKKALDKIKEYFKNEDIYISILNNKIAGFIIVNIDTTEKKKLFIIELWIKKEYQRKGIGKTLVRFIEKMYKKKGIKLFKLVANKKKGGAFNFYRKLKYNENKDLVFMDKKLK